MAVPAAHALHIEPLNRLKKGLAKSRLSHALILEGSRDAYVQDLALHMATHILCDGQDVTTQAPRVFNFTHPNVKVIESPKQTIAKDDIIQLQHDFNQTALEAGPKIYVIFDAEKMNAHAANALLKFLEEPHANIYGILVTHDALSLLPTILSRSQVISVQAATFKSIENALLEAGYSSQQSAIAATLFHDETRAKDFLEDTQMQSMIAHIPPFLAAAHTTQSLLKLLRDYWPDLDRDKHGVSHILDMMMLYLKDVIYAKLNLSHKALFSDSISLLEETAKHYESAQLIVMWSETLAFKEKLDRPIHLSLALDNWALMIERGDVI